MPLALHMSSRHCPFEVHVPSPFARPQALSFGSHTPDTQTRVPTAAVHVATLDGELGSGVPFASFGVHVPLPPVGALHQSPVAQSASVVHPIVQAPVVVSHVGPPGWPWQSVFVVHFPHSPLSGPLEKQYGLLAVGHASVAPEP